MSALPCRLRYRSTSPHLQQLYTGFLMLHESRFIHLSQELRRTECRYDNDAPHLLDAGHAHLDAVLDGRLRLHFDTHDSREIAVGELPGCDLYFKRSYSQFEVDLLPPDERHKIMPLGLNYRVLPDLVDSFSMRRSLAIEGASRNALSTFKQSLDVGNRFGYQPRLSRLEASPDFAAAPQVLFMVAAYDPYNDPRRSQDKIEDRIFINETRAQCLRLLKAALGKQFFGGFSPSAFTLDRYPELVLAGDTTSQQNYLETLKSYPICVATTGLHGSTGWKLAEYVAFAKAILSEKLLYGVPGVFEPGTNYLEFTSPEECVAAAVKLIDDADLRHQLMRNNADYYRSQLRPDAFVRNALLAALERAPHRSALPDKPSGLQDDYSPDTTGVIAD